MGWTSKSELKAQVQKLWDSGAPLAELAGAPSRFPLRLRLKTPTSSDMGAQFNQVRTWAAELRKTPHVRIVEREFNHKVLGKNALPGEVWLDSLEAAIEIVGKRRESKVFQEITAITKDALPELIPWLQRYPLKALSFGDVWKELLSIVQWMKANPQPGIFVRQIDLPGIHTKFVETHQSILTELLEICLDANFINGQASGSRAFEQRFGFKSKPTLVRFRVLDPRLTFWPISSSDNALDLETFAKLNCEIEDIYITENEINYLAFPDLPLSLVIFGKGFGLFPLLESAAWLRKSRVFYWGDIDTQGFSILNQARKIVPEIHSFLMDSDTLNKHLDMVVEEPKALPDAEFCFLTKEELAVCKSLRDLNHHANARLEQERIGWNFACERIRQTSKTKEPVTGISKTLGLSY